MTQSHQAAADLRALASAFSEFGEAQLALAETFERVVDRLVDAPNALVELGEVDCEVDAAGLAVKLSAAPHLSDTAARLHAALRAGHGDLLRIETQLRHFESSSVGVQSPTVGTESPAASNLAAGDEAGRP